MSAIKIYVGEGNTRELTSRIVTPLQITEQLDVTLDSGELNYIFTEQDTDGLREPLSMYFVIVEENLPSERHWQFVGIDSRAFLRRNTAGDVIYKHKVALTETSKLLQGVLIDGMAVTQPEDEGQRETLYDVTERLFKVAQFDDARNVVEKFRFSDANVIKILQAIKSPQFKWNTQTTLWECLEQIGAVIDAIPKVERGYDNDSGETESFDVAFEFVNATDNEATAISDQWVNIYGENVDESQYNTALGSVVENLHESE